MADQIVKVLVEGGKATAAPPLGPALGPMGVIIDPSTKQYEIEIGTPPTSALLRKEAGIEKGSGNPKTDKVADVLIEQIIKIAMMKEGNLLGKSLKERVKEIIGTCHSMGIIVEGKIPSDVIKEVNEGRYDSEISAEKTELTEEEKHQLEEERKRLAAELEKRRSEFERIAKEIITSMAGKERGAIKVKLKEAGIPDAMIKELLPVEGAGASATGTTPTSGAKAEAPKKEDAKGKSAKEKK